MAVIYPQIDTIFHQGRAFEKYGTQTRFSHLPSKDRILLTPHPKASKKHRKKLVYCLR